MDATRLLAELVINASFSRHGAVGRGEAMQLSGPHKHITVFAAGKSLSLYNMAPGCAEGGTPTWVKPTLNMAAYAFDTEMFHEVHKAGRLGAPQLLGHPVLPTTDPHMHITRQWGSQYTIPTPKTSALPRVSLMDDSTCYHTGNLHDAILHDLEKKQFSVKFHWNISYVIHNKKDWTAHLLYRITSCKTSFQPPPNLPSLTPYQLVPNTKKNYYILAMKMVCNYRVKSNKSSEKWIFLPIYIILN